MKKENKITPTRAMDLFVECKKHNQEVSDEVYQVISNYRNWNEFELTSLQNLSAYYPDIFIEKEMEEHIEKLITQIKKREVELPIS